MGIAMEKMEDEKDETGGQKKILPKFDPKDFG